MNAEPAKIRAYSSHLGIGAEAPRASETGYPYGRKLPRRVPYHMSLSQLLLADDQAHEQPAAENPDTAIYSYTVCRELCQATMGKSEDKAV